MFLKMGPAAIVWTFPAPGLVYLKLVLEQFIKIIPLEKFCLKNIVQNVVTKNAPGGFRLPLNLPDC